MVEQFNNLLTGVKASLEGGKTTLAERNFKQVPLAGNFIEEASMTVRKAEVSIEAFHAELRKSIHRMGQDQSMNMQVVQQIVHQKVLNDFSNVGVMVMGNKANDINEEVSSLTKGR